MKVLLLSDHDSTLAGHIQSVYNDLPSEVEAYMVTLYSYDGNKQRAFIKYGSIHYKFFKLISIVWRQLYCLFVLRCTPVIDIKHREYAFIDFDFMPFPTKQILNKCPKGFCPDIISIHWRSIFANPNTVRKLQEKTGAKILYQFVDEAPMTGGCHYPVNCKNYLSNCENCPALKRGKKLAKIQLKRRVSCLKDLPIYIWGTPSDIRLAKETMLFRKAICLPYIYKPKVTITEKSNARRLLGIDEDRFVVFVGSNSLKEERKGMVYSIDALVKANNCIDNMLVLSAGRFNLEIPNVDVHSLGFINTADLLLAFCASDCFLSTTIADSGPMMVNYSIAVGTPVISFTVGIAEDLVIHKETGYLAEYKSVNDLVDGLKYFAGLTPNERSLVSEQCIKHIDNKETPKLFEQVMNYENQ